LLEIFHAPLDVAHLAEFLDRDHERCVVERIVLGLPWSRESVDVHEVVRERADVVGDPFEILLQKEVLEIRLLASPVVSGDFNSALAHTNCSTGRREIVRAGG